MNRNDALRLVSLDVVCGSHGQHADMTLEIDGKTHSAKTTGTGPVDATFRAIRQLVPHDAALKLYQVHAVTGGTDAQVQVSVQLDDEGTVYNGHAADIDTLVASAQAYVSALNKWRQMKQKHEAAKTALDKVKQARAG